MATNKETATRCTGTRLITDKILNLVFRKQSLYRIRSGSGIWRVKGLCEGARSLLFKMSQCLTCSDEQTGKMYEGDPNDLPCWLPVTDTAFAIAFFLTAIAAIVISVLTGAMTCFISVCLSVPCPVGIAIAWMSTRLCSCCNCSYSYIRQKRTRRPQVVVVESSGPAAEEGIIVTVQ